MSRAPAISRTRLFTAVAWLWLCRDAPVCPWSKTWTGSTPKPLISRAAIVLGPNGRRASPTRASAKLLAGPLGPKEAVQLALINSPALQALVAQGWADSAPRRKVVALPTPFSV
jgi:hypothetical protein